MRVPPHLLDVVIRSALLGTPLPKVAHDCGVEMRFLPQCVTVDAPAASIYDDNEMLCSILGQLSSEIKEVTVR